MNTQNPEDPSPCAEVCPGCTRLAALLAAEQEKGEQLAGSLRSLAREKDRVRGEAFVLTRKLAVLTKAAGVPRG